MKQKKGKTRAGPLARTNPGAGTGKRVRIAPSILSADFAHLAEEVRRVEEGGAALLHVDIMDGHFAPNLTIGPPVVEALRRVTSLPLDVHLMIEEPDRYIPVFVEAGAAMVSVHCEACPHLHRTLHLIRSLGTQAGAAVNPSTAVSLLEPVLDDTDFILLMSVNPGFGGQKFIPSTLDKAKALRKLLRARKRSIPIEMDGGLGEANVRDAVKAGVSIVVAGSSVFGAPDPAEAVRRLRAEAQRK
ncbi:MAG: ribulose-phosphate 3-epimerase [Acidobacteriota bacterium]|nr:MAG: ribulose-phosphate 3-epimerase [Acidobacteriota bacterium]